jgi:hemoglobin/transferrin/lactoferrin receptor protein
MKLFWGLFLVLFYLNNLFAQNLTIKDKQTGQPLELVVIYSSDPQVSATTDKNGQADISDFMGSDSICMEHIGYKTIVVSYLKLKTMDFLVLMDQVPFKMDEVIVSATRWQQDKGNSPQKVATIRRSDVEFQNPQTAADMLNTSGEVFIQKSQLGGGSPMIRGFATNRLLIAVDGVRMNTAIFRSGNLQNVISLDPLAIERTEVLLGPGSVMYGSDAIGAVMSFYTLNPEFSNSDDLSFSGQSELRTSSADFEKTAHANIAIGMQKWAFLSSFTYTDYGHLIMGSYGPDEYLRRQYVKTIDGMDSTVSNPDPKKQISSGYSQINLMQKIRFVPNKNWDINLGIHYSTTSEYPRYDRLLRYRSENLRSAEWYYGPQIWSLNSLNVRHSAAITLYDNMSSTFAWQYFEESRHDRNFRSTELTNRTEKVNAYSVNIDLNKSISKKNHLYYGAELVFNKVGSTGTDEDISTNSSVPGPSRYPDGSTWNSYAAYLNYRYFINQSWIAQAGLRYNYVTLDAEFDTTFYKFPFTSVSIDPGALIGSLGLVYNQEPDLQMHINFSTGFRAPNVDDIGKVFDSEPGSVVVPNPGLKPEYAYNAELGLMKIFNDQLKIDLNGYYTILDNAMVRRDFALNGADSIYYDGELSQVQAIQNSAKAHVWGIETGIEIKLPASFSILSRLNYQKGEEELDDGSTAPLRHAGPWFGDAHLKWARQKLIADLYVVYNGTISNKDLAPEEQGKDYMYAIDSKGNPYSPGWYTINLKAEYKWNTKISLSGGIENITDQRYRPYSSGICAPGRSFIAAIKLTF